MPNHSQSRAMQIVSVRFGTEQITLIQDEAGVENVSVSQYIRDSAYARAILSAARRNATTVAMWDKLIAVVEEAGHDQLGHDLRDLLDAVRAEDEAARRAHHGINGGA
jgi:uncharacterized protein (DUF1778 family)